jgi:hypothetical protein
MRVDPSVMTTLLEVRDMHLERETTGKGDGESLQSRRHPHHSGDSIKARDEEPSSGNALTLANPLTWQLTTSTDPSSEDQDVPNIQNQPKAVISSAFPFFDGSNYAPGIRVPPCWSFSIGFHPIFSIPAESPYADRRYLISYSLRLQNGSDLPGWMDWNMEYITLSGVTPCAEETSGQEFQEEYGIRMIGSLPPPDDEITAAQSFTMIVAFHSFEYLRTRAGPGALTLNMTTGGERIEQPLLFGGFDGVSGVFLDGQPVTEESIEDVQVSADWASVETEQDAASRILILSHPKPNNTILPVTLTSIFGERLEVPLDLSFQDSFFRYSAAGWLNNASLIVAAKYHPRSGCEGI